MKRVISIFLTAFTLTSFPQSFTGPTINPFDLESTGGFNNPVLVDIDNDNDYDCFNGLITGYTSFFENTGTAGFPDFADWYINPFGIFDAGNNAQPAFEDIDNDNDLDVYVGEAGFTIYFLRNTGTVSSPNFTFISTNPDGITGLGSNVSPVFVDIDDDNDFDLFTGETNGTISFYRNIGTVSNPQFGNEVTTPFGLTDVGSRSSPSFCDIDLDEDFDAFIGNEAGNIIFFLNSGSKTNPAFDPPVTNPFGLSDVGSFSSPTFADINNDGKEDLFVGTETGSFYYFRNTTIVSVEEEQNSNFVELKAYPNPVNGILNLSTKNVDL
ncbi:MAG: FG-GAP repeat domain-containing protein, partial [Ignavibacteriales bacterium]